ncbi:MAG: beta-ketoacyl-[acyl-carrier-protein] synthase family protein [Pseudomonadota bacterium]
MENKKKRIVVSGMGINTPLGDNLDDFFKNLVAGKSAITKWKFLDTSRIYSKVGGDLSEYDVDGKVVRLGDLLPRDMYKRLRKLIKKAPFSTRIGILCAVDAFLDSGLKDSVDSTRMGIIVGGHNLHNNLFYKNVCQFEEEPEYIDSMLALHSLDTDGAASIGETLGIRGATYTVGGACASANVALRSALDEIRYHDHDVIFVTGKPLDFSPIDLHAMAIMGAIGYESFNDQPEKASRPYDVAREGFIPSHGAGVLVVEELQHALDRNARIYAEVLDVATAADACHLPTPSVEGQARTMNHLLKNAGVSPEQIDYVNAHATSTPLGDVTEINSIKRVFGNHARKLKINATKSMLGHTCWSAPAVESVAAILQMRNNKLHPSINIDKMDPEVNLDVCANEAVDCEINYIMKNSFGFGGINCCALYRKFDASSV